MITTFPRVSVVVPGVLVVRIIRTLSISWNPGTSPSQEMTARTSALTVDLYQVRMYVDTGPVPSASDQFPHNSHEKEHKIYK